MARARSSAKNNSSANLGFEAKLWLTACAFTYRLIKHAGARNVLFLVDRANLGRQAMAEFQQFVTPDGRKFTELNMTAYNIYGPGADEILWRYQYDYGHIRYHTDKQGNVTSLLDINGNGLEKYTYDAFGQPKITDWSGNVRTTSLYGNRFMFQGREYLSTFGIYDYRHRFYVPALGRFIENDPSGFDGGDMNLFRFCGGDPVNGSDPSGLTVQYAPGTDVETFQNTVYDYLSKSAAFRDAYSQIATSTDVYTFRQTFDGTNGFDPSTRSIYWDPTAPNLTGLGGEQSPALGLAHEVGHAAFYDQDPSANLLFNTIQVPGFSGSLEEYRNMTEVERTVAIDLGEPTGSDHANHGDAPPVDGPTDGVWGNDLTGDSQVSAGFSVTVSGNDLSRGFTPYSGGYQGGAFGSLAGVAAGAGGGVLNITSMFGGGGRITEALLGH
jgi:RHS repeat-associated protein